MKLTVIESWSDRPIVLILQPRPQLFIDKLFFVNRLELFQFLSGIPLLPINIVLRFFLWVTNRFRIKTSMNIWQSVKILPWFSKITLPSIFESLLFKMIQLYFYWFHPLRNMFYLDLFLKI